MHFKLFQIILRIWRFWNESKSADEFQARSEKKEILRLVNNEYSKVKSKENEDITRRIFKTMMFVLNQNFGFGHDRLNKALKEMTEVIKHSSEDEVFWEHLDRVVIDQLKLPFQRDYTEKGQVVNERRRE